jgi:acyl carrier protein
VEVQMTQDEALAQLKEILQGDFKVPPEKVVWDASFRGNLGLDSLDAVDLIYLIGKRFSVSANIENFRDLHTVRKVVDYIVEAKRRGA